MRKGGETQDRSSEITRENAVAKWRKRIEDDKDRPSSSLGEPAEMGTGLFATFIDLIVAVLTPIVIIVTIGLYLEIAKVPTNDPDGNWIIIFFPMIPLVWILHGWLLTGLKGQTLGKMMCRIKVVDIAGENPGLWAALLRETIGKAVDRKSVV